MASTVTSGYFVESRRIERVVRYHWPAVQLNVWMLIMLISACTIIGVFATFIGIQSQLLLPIPWYFTYYIIVGSLVVTFIAILLWLIFSRRLLPSIVMIGGFILFVMWLVGLVVVSIELWGPSSGPTGSVSGNCNLAVFTQNPTGQTLQTLAWLEQRSICQSWQAVFAFALIGQIFLLWIMIIAYQVFADNGS
ncbi:hypothetical protein GGTG_02539 [Gaeumannomyces tritici R3-111a-1]|uniref:MARVEL domain-containing protein n=1 Tax=Gaeumannomyces tritici (strain R3-111a-1) TaxID=644352 RepID=J3NMN3_GAET3|nr:hypothetical protein GGTG_02539 [Gaeumannomyces tritici R3-111a-1]EJT82566.1 hypothetical protein GGTG_02539 [Gaeumannomyces tritici R3-111a-1]